MSKSGLINICSVATGRHCDGYSSLPFSRRDLQAASSIRTKTLFDQQHHTSEYFLRMDQPSEFQISIFPQLVNDPTFSDVLEKVLEFRLSCPEILSNRFKAILSAFQATYNSKHKFPSRFPILEPPLASDKPPRTGDQACCACFDRIAP